MDIIRGYLQKSLSATMEFIIESEKGRGHCFDCLFGIFLPNEHSESAFSVIFSTDTLPEKPISPEMVFFYITQDTQRHLLLSHLKLGLLLRFSS